MMIGIEVTPAHAAAVRESERLQQAFSDLTGRYEALLRDCHPCYSAGEHHITPIPAAVRDVIAERRRQMHGEGWTLAHDDNHTEGELARAAAAYALVGALSDDRRGSLFPSSWGCVLRDIWPDSWSRSWFKPKRRREDLVRAASLLIADIERIDRAEKRRA